MGLKPQAKLAGVVQHRVSPTIWIDVHLLFVNWAHENAGAEKNPNQPRHNSCVGNEFEDSLRST